MGQNYKRFKILYVDDASDYSRRQVVYIRNVLKDHVCVFRKQRRFSVYNANDMLRNFVDKKNSVVLTVDADDWLSSPNSLSFLAAIYKDPEIFFSYGSCLLWNGESYKRISEDPLYTHLNTEYTQKSIKEGDYLREPFRIFHPMSFRYKSFLDIPKEKYMEDGKTWFKYCFDLATFLPLLNMHSEKYKFVKEELYVYNSYSSNTNIKKNPYDFVREDLHIRSKNIHY